MAQTGNAKAKLKKPDKFVLDFQFPELNSVKMRQSVVVEATNMGMALLRGYQEIRKRDGVKKHRISTAKVTIGTLEEPKQSSSESGSL